jgi:hypothetical protein
MSRTLLDWKMAGRVDPARHCSRPQRVDRLDRFIDQHSSAPRADGMIHRAVIAAGHGPPGRQISVMIARQLREEGQHGLAAALDLDPVIQEQLKRIRGNGNVAQPACSCPAAGSPAIANPAAQQIPSPRRTAVTRDRDDCIQPLLFEKIAVQPLRYTGQSKPTFRTRLSHRVVPIRVSGPSRSWPPMPAVARSGRERDREPRRLAPPAPSPPSSPSRADRP